MKLKFVDQRDAREKRLEEELREEKIRFTESSAKAVNAIQKNLRPSNWVKAYPLESIALIALAGFFTGYLISQSQKRAPLDITPVL